MSKLKLSGKNTIGTYNNGTGFGDYVYGITIEPNSGKTYVGGYFETFNSSSQYKLIRLNTDGTKDTTFDIGTGFGQYNLVCTTLVRPDGKIFVGGMFYYYNDIDVPNALILLNEDGTLNTSFNANEGFNNYVYGIIMNSDGKLYACGAFKTFYDGSYQYYLVRINSDGTKDTGFDINTAPWNGGFNENGSLNGIDLDSNEKVYVCGVFSSYSGVTYSNSVMRFNTNGIPDSSFAPTFSGSTICLKVDSNDKIYVGGLYSVRFGPTYGFIYRLNSDGTIDNSFNGGGIFDQSVTVISIDNNGKILIGGDFTTCRGSSYNHIVRLNTNGSIDNTFNPHVGFANATWRYILTIDTDSSNKIYVGGTFQSYQGTTQKYLIRLNHDGSSDMYRINNNNKIKFSGGAKYNVLNFNSDAYVDFTSNPTLYGLTGPISFYLYMDLDNYTNIGMIIYSCDSNGDTNNELIVFLYNNYLWIQTGTQTRQKVKVDITSYNNKTILVEFKRTDGAQAATVDYVKFDGVSQILITPELNVGVYQQNLIIGTFYNPSSSQYVVKLYSATIWDLIIPGRYHWKGYTGNIDAGWVDQIGSINGTVSGTTKTNREVSGVSTSKLKIVPPPPPPPVDSSFKLEITTSSPNQSITIPHIDGYTYNYMVDYGDGSSPLHVTSYNDSNCTHVYVTPGAYTLKISGTCESFYVNYGGSMPSTLTEIIQWGDVGLKSINFYGCSHNRSIPDDIIGGLARITDFNFAFGYNTLLTSIPVGLFAHATGAINFTYTFYYCVNITTIPSDLFRYNTLATTFYWTFCFNFTSLIIPADLFKYNVNATIFDGTFYYTYIPSIPEDLFKYNVNAVSFTQTFQQCTNLLTIPEGLFRNQVNATSFRYTFANCTGLSTVPSGLFSGCTLANNFYQCFYKSFNITSAVPTLWTTFPSASGTECFRDDKNATNYTSIPEEWGGIITKMRFLFKTFDSMTTITLPHLSGYTYDYYVDYGDGTGLFHVTSWNDTGATHIYYGAATFTMKIGGTCETFCVSSGDTILPIIQKIVYWGNVGLKVFTFSGCTNLTDIPNDPIGGLVLVNDFSYVFAGCTGLTSAAPQFWIQYSATTGTGCFSGDVNLYNYSYIPASWGGLGGTAEPFMMEVHTPYPNYTLTIPHKQVTSDGNYNYVHNYYIDWGDGTGEFHVSSYDDPNHSHNYSLGGTYTIQISGVCETIDCWQGGGSTTMMSTLQKILQWGHIQLLDFTVMQCTSLTDVQCPDGKGASLISDWTYSFYYCTSLTGLTSTMFSGCTKMSYLQYTFYYCTSLTTIPLTLFDGLNGIPYFGGTFYQCTALTGNAPELWVTYPSSQGSQCFNGDTGLTNYASIPSNWK